MNSNSGSDEMYKASESAVQYLHYLPASFVPNIRTRMDIQVSMANKKSEDEESEPPPWSKMQITGHSGGWTASKILLRNAISDSLNAS